MAIASLSMSKTASFASGVAQAMGTTRSRRAPRRYELPVGIKLAEGT